MKKLEHIISISSSPGSFGETVHNKAYKKFKLNYLYRSIKVNDLKMVTNAMRELQIKGCSVSMPFKENIIKYLDKIDMRAKKVGAVNTILNKNSKLIGYNTDVYGAIKSIRKLKLNTRTKIIILGSGGVSRAILEALNILGYKNLTISSRNVKTLNKISKKFKCKKISWKNRNNIVSDCLINATPIGMNNETNISLFFTPVVMNNFKKIMDVVVSKTDTALIKFAKKQNIDFVSGIYMTTFQAIKQFEIYTNIIPEVSFFRSLTRDFLNKKN